MREELQRPSRDMQPNASLIQSGKLILSCPSNPLPTKHPPFFSTPVVRISPSLAFCPHSYSVSAIRLYRSGLSFRCHGISDVADMFELEWRPALDHFLLVSSIALAYVARAGATPAVKATEESDFAKMQEPTTASSVIDKIKHWGHTDPYTIEKPWKNIDKKVKDAVLRLEEGAAGMEIPASGLYLQAIAAGPRLRLILTTLELLRKELEGLHKNGVCSNELQSWSEQSSDILCKVALSICKSWFLHELSLIKKDTSFGPFKKSQFVEKSPEKDYFTAAIQGDEWRSYTLSFLTRNGKAELYADCCFFLSFNSLRKRSYCNYEVFLAHVTDIIEDMVISLADVAASIYLCVLSDGNLQASENEYPSLLLSSVASTRMLDRFRNEVALKNWISENFKSVVAIYEDRLELWTLREDIVQKDKRQYRRNSSKILQKKSLSLVQINLPLKRLRELKTLRGWKLCYSLYLEFADVIGPLLQIFLAKAGEAISFLLVTLIGRSLGLIYRGIRQSLRWS